MFSPHPPLIEAAPHRWKSTCAPRPDLARCHGAARRPRLSDLTLSFSVSLDEEFVRLETACGGRVVDLGARNHNYLLLTLARRRLQEAEAGLPSTTTGWIYVDELGHDPSLGGTRLNVDVFRIRRQFAKLGVTEAEGIIERRARMSQLRIGTDRITIARV